MTSINQITRPLSAIAAAALALTLTACSSGSGAGTDAETQSGTANSGEAAAAFPLTVTDNEGEHTFTQAPSSIVALDNRTFETLSDWGVPLKAAAVSLMPDTIPYAKDASIVDIGNHREPNLEAIVAAEPDLVIVGQRFSQYTDDIKALVPDATLINLDPRDDQPFDQELKRQVTTLGQIFDKQAEAQALTAAFDDSVAALTDAYASAQSPTVMAVNSSGGEIGYIAPTVGRTLGPVFDFAGLKPALEVEGSTDDHQGDDISVEAIADSNPDWILVMDRDAAVSADDPSYTPAAEIIEDNPALANVTAVKDGHIVYMPADTYTNEGIQTYTEFLGSFADALTGATA